MTSWKPVAGFEGLFKVSDRGQVYSLRTNRILKQYCSGGYQNISTRVDGKAICFKVHRLVAEAFLPSPSFEIRRECAESGLEVVPVNHIDGDKANNRLSNLEWSSPARNARHAFDLGLARPHRGSANNMAKLTEANVAAIRRAYRPGCRVNGGRAMARRYGVAHTTIQDVVSGERWAHMAQA